MAYEQAPSGEYGKRPVWQWILIYVFIGGIIYLLVYYFVFARKGGYNANTTNYSVNANNAKYSVPVTNTTPTPSPEPEPTSPPAPSPTPTPPGPAY